MHRDLRVGTYWVSLVVPMEALCGRYGVASAMGCSLGDVQVEVDILVNYLEMLMFVFLQVGM